MQFNLVTFLYAIVSFGILYWLLSKYAFGPLFSVMEKRRQLVVGELQAAEKNRKEAEALLEEQKKVLENARREAYEIIEQARATSTRQAEEIVRRAEEEAKRRAEEALKEIEREKQKAIAQLKSQVAALSVLIASKIIEKQIDEKSQAELVDHYLREVGERG